MVTWVQVVSFADWQRIDDEEVRRGQELGKPREKITSIPEMLRVAAAA
jgi:adrenodoxin-NADP+ reductase